MNENENTTFRNLLHVAKAMLRVKFRPTNAYIPKKKLSNQYPNFVFSFSEI